MLFRGSNIVKIKKLKKDGSIDEGIISRITDTIKNKGIVILPVDNIYGVVGITSAEIEDRISKVLSLDEKKTIRLISSFKMLNDIASYTKFDYDFLNRVWPGEVNVILKKKAADKENRCINIRFPKNRFLQSVISSVECPLFVTKIYNKRGALVYRQNDIVKGYGDKVELVVIIEELCKRHPISTLIDISRGELKIVHEGKVPSDEIKSLYFLGKDDDLIY